MRVLGVLLPLVLGALLDADPAVRQVCFQCANHAWVPNPGNHVVYRHRVGTRCACTALCTLLSGKLKLVEIFLVGQLALPRSPHLMPQG